MFRAAECHPDRKHKALGMCLRCYKNHLAKKAYSTEKGKLDQKIRTQRYVSTEKGKENRRQCRIRHKESPKYLPTRRYHDKLEARIEYKRKLENMPHMKQARKKYRQQNRGVVNAATAQRRARKRQASLKGYFKEETKKVYKSCPEGMEVDHILPLSQESGICGLHVPWNLQFLNKSQNSFKSDKWDGTYDNESWRTQ